MFSIQKVLSILSKWEGFDVLSGLIDQFPGVRIYLAGGAIRNALLGGRAVADFDFFLQGPQPSGALDYLAGHGTLGVGELGSPRWWPSSETAEYCDIVPIERVNHGLGQCLNIVNDSEPTCRSPSNC